MRTYVLTKEQRQKIKDYIDVLPEKMPQTIKMIRHVLSKVDLDEMIDDIYLLKTLKHLEMPIGRTKGEGWRDQRGKFVVRPEAAVDQPSKFVVRHKEETEHEL